MVSGAALWRGFVSALQISPAEKKICQGRSKTQGTRAEVFHDVLLSHEMPIGTKEGDDQGDRSLARNAMLVVGPKNVFPTWGWVKTLVPSEPQNSRDLWMFIPLKMYL